MFFSQRSQISLLVEIVVVSTLLNFVRMFDRAHQENCKQLEFEKKKAQKESDNEKLKISDTTKEGDEFMQNPLKSRSIK